jgi:5S rRNA maturation endonuclease (ribonuclease M5)
VRDGKLKFKDFSSGKSGDSFNLVKELNPTESFPQILERIAKDFGLLNGKNVNTSIVKKEYILPPEEPSEIKVIPKDWETHEIAYWVRYGVTLPTLKIFNVRPCREVWINDFLHYIYNKNNPCFRYTLDGGFKIYIPLHSKKELKFRTNIRKEVIWGLEQLTYKTDTCFIVSSLKDIMCLYELGFEAVCMNSESCDIPDKLINYLKTKYEHVIIFLDADSTGLKFAKKVHKRIDIPYLYIPLDYKCKDQSDCFLKHGKIILKELILELLETYIYTL